mmetsp:Transcript_38734/g.58171  ORF Transcript_38734/g.58171 Transcript_38734/m.58171 type:complete len:90 (+) Transcript_38734:652-921(+)
MLHFISNWDIYAKREREGMVCVFIIRTLEKWKQKVRNEPKMNVYCCCVQLEERMGETSKRRRKYIWLRNIFIPTHTYTHTTFIKSWRDF